MGKLLDGAYKTLIQGVSQQSPIDRIDGQHEELKNMSSDPEKGLLRRPPTTLVGKLTGGTVYKDIEVQGDQYILEIDSTNTRAYTLDGKAVTVSGTDSAKEYLTGSASFGVISTQDHVILSNPNIVTKMMSDLSPENNTRGIVHVIGGQYGRKFEITVQFNGTKTSVDYTTPDGSASAHGAQIATDYIATQLETKLRAALTAFNVERNSDVILLKYKGTAALTAFDIAVADGDGGVNLVGFTNTLGSSGKLSRFAPHGYTVRITGSESTYADDWYLKFAKDSESTDLVGTGVWVETVKPGIKFKYNLGTMPHIISKTDTGLEIAQGEWDDRTVGDDDSNPIPEFIGLPINDIGIFQGRLVFLSGSNVVLSRTNMHTSFWKDSAVALVDDDVISVSSATTRSAPTMRRAVPHNRDLVIFSDEAQFIIFGRTAITPRNTSLVLTTAYGANLTAPPVSSGRNIFYAMDLGGYTGIKEFYTEGDIDVNASRPVTAHCTRYIPGSATLMVTSTNFNKLLVKTTASKERLFVYDSLWMEGQKVQSAWGTWEFKNEVKFCAFISDEIYIVLHDTLNTTLLRMELDRHEDVQNLLVHLDSKVQVQNVLKEITIPSVLLDYEDSQFIQGAGCPEPGLEVPISSTEPGIIHLHYSMNGGTVICGVPYSSEVTLTQPNIRDRAEEPVTTGRLSVHHFTVHTLDSGYMMYRIDTLFRTPITGKYDVRTVSSPVSMIGKPTIDSYQAVVPFMFDVTKAKLTLLTSRHTPLRIIQITWKGDYVKSGTHIGG